MPAVIFSSAFQASLSPVHTTSSTVDDDGSSLQSLHIAVDDVTPQPSPLPAESPHSTVPQFHYDDPDELSPTHHEASTSSTTAFTSDIAASSEIHLIPHTDSLSTHATVASHLQPVASSTTAAAALASPVATASTSASSSPSITAAAHPAAIPPMHSTAKASTCRVVSCTERAEKEGYCLPHHKLFKPTTQVVEETSELKAKREKKERKSREQQLAALKEKSSTMPSPSASGVSAAPVHSSSLHAAAGHSSPQPHTASPSSSPGWFGRRKMSSEAKEARGATAGGECDGEEGGVVGDALLVETRRAWRLANKVVSKDVPRLAKRMSVIDDKRVCVLWGRTVQEEEVGRATKPRLSVSVSLSQQEALAEEEAAASTQPQPQSQDDEKQSATTDPPSPKSRVKGKEVLESELPDITTWQAITNVVVAVAEHLESPDTVARTRDHFHRIALTLTPHTDLEAPLSDVLNGTLGLASPTFAVFRATHQSILFPAVYSLKTNLYTQVGPMKDVRRHDGWQVEIYIGEGRVWITHVRREQSMEAEDSVVHFEVEWEIRLSFDRAMEECRAVFLRIQGLTFHPQMPRERKQQIVQVLKGAGYIV